MKILCSVVLGTRKDGKHWISVCPCLEICSMGDSRANALAAVEKAVELWIESCVRRGTLREALRQLGFSAMDRLPLTKDVFTLDDEDYWRFPEYLPAAEWDHLVQVVPSRTAEERPAFQYQAHEESKVINA